MNWDLIVKIASIFTGFGIILSIAGFAIKGLITYIVNINADEDDDEHKLKAKEGKLHFIFGTCATVVLIIVMMWIYSSESSDRNSELSDETTIISTTEEKSEITTNETLTMYYVKDLRYEDAIYSGFVDKDTKLPDGKGKMVYINGNVYDGNWIDGIQNGYGIIKYHNGDSYDGMWKNGKKDGKGIYVWKDGKEYNGEYKDDKRNGNGSYTGWTGYISTYGWKGNYYGSNKDDKFEGYGTFEFDNGDKFIGIFSSNEFWNGMYKKSDGFEYEIINGKPS